MKTQKTHIHFLFQIGVVFKGIDGVLEAVTGGALFFVSPASLRGLVGWLTQGELQEDPTDFVANHLVDFFRHLSINTKHFASVYLLTYGITKVVLVAGLLRGKLLAYPTALMVLGLFLCYQVYRAGHNRSLGLGFLSALDLLILILIWFEYKRLKAERGHPGALKKI
ncbi:MAG TPA: DUF2127 domain-containing protein [Verrucomicrobiae bacterium]